MTTTIYFGATPTGTRLVHPDLAAKKINLIRAATCELDLAAHRWYDHDNYNFYLNQFPIFVHSFIEKKIIVSSDRPGYYKAPATHLPKFLVNPRIIFTLSNPSTETANNVKGRFNAIECTARGKPAFTATLTKAQVASLIKDFSPITDTPYSLTSLNIDGYKIYVRLWSLVRVILKTHQYPLVSGTGTNTSGLIDRQIVFDISKMTQSSAGVYLEY
jgi:hypothetical protein